MRWGLAEDPARGMENGIGRTAYARTSISCLGMGKVVHAHHLLGWNGLHKQHTTHLCGHLAVHGSRCTKHGCFTTCFLHRDRAQAGEGLLCPHRREAHPNGQTLPFLLARITCEGTGRDENAPLTFFFRTGLEVRFFNKCQVWPDQKVKNASCLGERESDDVDVEQGAAKEAKRCSCQK